MRSVQDVFHSCVSAKCSRAVTIMFVDIYGGYYQYNIIVDICSGYYQYNIIVDLCFTAFAREPNMLISINNQSVSTFNLQCYTPPKHATLYKCLNFFQSNWARDAKYVNASINKRILSREVTFVIFFHVAIVTWSFNNCYFTVFENIILNKLIFLDDNNYVIFKFVRSMQVFALVVCKANLFLAYLQEQNLYTSYSHTQDLFHPYTIHENSYSLPFHQLIQQLKLSFITLINIYD